MEALSGRLPDRVSHDGMILEGSSGARPFSGSKMLVKVGK